MRAYVEGNKLIMEWSVSALENAFNYKPGIENIYNVTDTKEFAKSVCYELENHLEEHESGLLAIEGFMDKIFDKIVIGKSKGISKIE